MYIWYSVIMQISIATVAICAIVNLIINLKLSMQGDKIMATLAELQAQVEQTIGIEQSAITLIQGIKQQLQDLINAGADPAALQELVDKLDVSEQALSAAVVTNP